MVVEDVTIKDITAKALSIDDYVSAALAVRKKLSKKLNISEVLISSKSRKKDACHSRMVINYILKVHTPLSLERIGTLTEIMEARDHATVLHAVKTINGILNKEQRFTRIPAKQSPLIRECEQLFKDILANNSTEKLIISKDAFSAILNNMRDKLNEVLPANERIEKIHFTSREIPVDINGRYTWMVEIWVDNLCIVRNSQEGEKEKVWQFENHLLNKVIIEVIHFGLNTAFEISKAFNL